MSDQNNDVIVPIKRLKKSLSASFDSSQDQHLTNIKCDPETFIKKSDESTEYDSDDNNNDTESQEGSEQISKEHFETSPKDGYEDVGTCSKEGFEDIENSPKEGFEDVETSTKENFEASPEESQTQSENNQHNSESIKTINDLNENCLNNILSRLDFMDLLNASNAAKKIRSAAQEIYNQNYAEKVVKYNGDTMGLDGSEIEITSDTIEVNKSRTCLKMLLGFGSCVEKIYLNFTEIGARRIQAISDYLCEHCASTLVDLEWHCCPKNALDQSKPFTKLQILRIISGHLGSKMSQFNRKFPNLRRLELVGVEVEDRKCIEATFKNLQHLKIGIEKRKGVDFLKINVKTALKFNPLLRSFSIFNGCDVKLLEFINDMLPRLEKLEIQSPRNKFFDDKEDKVRFNLVKSLTLDIAESKDKFTNIPFEFRRLKKFKLNAELKYRNEWIDFVAQNPNLVELQLLNFNWFYVMKEVHLTKIAGLPKLQRFILEWRVPDTGAICRFIEKCEKLEKFRISMRTLPERAAIFAEIGTGWLLEVDDNFLMLVRTAGDVEADIEIDG